MSKKKLVYILPTNFEHVGIKLKVLGQLDALKKRFSVSLHSFNYSRKDNATYKLWNYIIYELSTCIKLLTYQYIYIRYNPKLLLTNLLLPLLSFFKDIYVEHNTLMDTELIFLKRPVEHKIHRFTLYWFRIGKMIHIAVNNQLKKHLNLLGLKQVIYAQNGYLTPAPNDIDVTILNSFQQFKSKFQHCAIFIGNGYPWHGLTEIIELLSPYKDIGLIVVGPYNIAKSSNILSIQHCLSSTLIKIVESCDFAISTFRWDMLDITEGSPLKSRQYLCHGCPILVNYYDCAADFDELKPYIIDFRHHKNESIKIISQLINSKEDIKKKSRFHLSWHRFFDDVFS